MPKQITKTVYTFKELLALKEKGKVTEWAIQTVRQTLQEFATGDGYWHDSTIEEYKEVLEKIGFQDSEIAFRGFSNQGDGASFTCKHIAINKLVEFLGMNDLRRKELFGFEPIKSFYIKSEALRKFKRLVPFLSAHVNRTSSNYSHEYTCKLSLEIDSRGLKRVEALTDKLQETLEELRVDICQSIYKDLEKEYEYRSNDEQLIENSEANQYLFTINGSQE